MKVILKYTTFLKENDVISRDSRKSKAIIFMFFPSVRTKALLQDRKTLSLQTPLKATQTNTREILV